MARMYSDNIWSWSVDLPSRHQKMNTLRLHLKTLKVHMELAGSLLLVIILITSYGNTNDIFTHWHDVVFDI